MAIGAGMREAIGPGGWRRCALVLFAALASLCAGPPIASAVEVQTHVFDPVLSLTGNCQTSEADPVPDPWCPGPPAPSGRFNIPRSETTDEYGDVYVASTPATREGGVIDIFSPTGEFLTEIPDHHAPLSVAVDSKGHLYVFRSEGGFEIGVVRYDPELFEPEAGEIKYKEPPVHITNVGTTFSSVAVDTSDDHLYVGQFFSLQEYGSAAEGNPLITGSIGNGILTHSRTVAVHPTTGDIYVSDTSTEELDSPAVIRVFDGDAPHPLIRTIDGSACLAAGHFASKQGHISTAIDGSNGHLFIYDGMESPKAVYEFDETGSECISKTERSFSYIQGNQIAIDNGPKSPNGALDPDGRYLFVPSGLTAGESHLWAFEPRHIIEPPVVESVSFSEVSTTDATLEATINPKGGTTSYTLEYTTLEAFEAEEWEGAVLAEEGTIPAGKIGVKVSAVAEGLSPGTTYRFRARAENDCETVVDPATECDDEAAEEFTTFATPEPLPPCENDPLRLELGLSALLPDCRAYELVSPPNTGGRALFDPQYASGAGDTFGSPTAASSGDVVVFETKTGSLPGTGAGGMQGTPYRVERDATIGWQTEATGPNGTEAANSFPGGFSRDLGYNAIRAAGAGTLVIEGKTTAYVRHPDGSYELVGDGSLTDDPGARVRYMAPSGSHIIFNSEVPLEPKSPASGTRAIYDRSGGQTHVVSLLPPIDSTPTDNAFYEGASTDGTAIAFKIGTGASPLYARLDDAETLELSGPGATFAGFSEDGRYAFYLDSGDDLHRLDTETEADDEITTTGDATVVNVASSGAAVYFVSQSVLTGEEENPAGAKAQPGGENLYRWSGGTTGFVATVTARDVEGEFSGPGGFQMDGLGLWAEAMEGGDTAIDPSRTTPSGSAFLFESRADLTGYDSGGKAQVYRFDSTEPALGCLSCAPTGAPPASDASLQTLARSNNDFKPTSRFPIIPNLSPDGRRAFFQTLDALVIADTDGFQDVYEWEADEVGSCEADDGCTYLISSGQSYRDDYLYGASENGDDVFIWTSDLLLGRDAEEAPSIYDARVEGGFPEPVEGECEGEGCRPGLTPPPALPPMQTGESDNLRDEKPKRCPKGKRRVRRHGHYVCIRKHKRHHHRHHRSHKSGGAGR